MRDTLEGKCGEVLHSFDNNSFRRVVFIFLLAIISNVILAAVVTRGAAPTGPWEGEVARIAASVARGQGFSSPFRQPTGPSAWIPPVYPYFLAGIFRVFGVFTATSYRVNMAVNIAVHALACILLYRAAGEVFGQRTGWYSGCALASFPLLFFPLVLLHVLGDSASGEGLFIPPNEVWYIHFSELAFVLLIWLTLHPPHWIVYGTAWGVVSLLNPTVLAAAPAFVGWRLWHRQSWRYAGLAVAGAAFFVAPWLVRNYLVFHRLTFVRDDFGVELNLGNQVGGSGRWKAEIHPDQSTSESSRVAKVGEAEYARAAGQQALHIIRAHPSEFVRNTILRVGYYWIGTPMKSRRLGNLQFVKYLPALTFSMLAFLGASRALRHKNGNALLFVAVLFFYPLIYYVTHTFSGYFYQYTIHPEMLALATSVVIRDNTPSDSRHTSLHSVGHSG